METKTMIEKLEDSEEYNRWKKENESCYLAHVFKMLDAANKDEWQIGYYNPENKMITTFVLDEKDGSIRKNPEAETFKETEEKIKELVPSDIVINLNIAMQKAEQLRKQKYPQHDIDKALFILQKLDVGQVWNFTFITKTFHVLNVKISSTDGNIIEEKLSSIFEFKDDQA